MLHSVTWVRVPVWADPPQEDKAWKSRAPASHLLAGTSLVSEQGWMDEPNPSAEHGACCWPGAGQSERRGARFLVPVTLCQSLLQGGKQNAAPGDISPCSFSWEGSQSAGWLAAVTAPSAPTWAHGGTGSLLWHRAAGRARPDGAAVLQRSSWSRVCPYLHASLLTK